MDDYIVYMIRYEGQWKGGPAKTHGGDGISPYTWIEHSHDLALRTMEELEHEYPDRKWFIVEKDVS